MGAVRPLLVVELPPAFDQHLRFGAAEEPFPVQKLVPKLAVEALDEPVLPGATRRDEGRADRRARLFCAVESTYAGVSINAAFALWTNFRRHPNQPPNAGIKPCREAASA